jgi:hypothetical protein
MPRSSWHEDSLTFGLITGWILTFTITLIIFINNYLPTGISLIDGIYGQKLLLALPVLLVMGFAFFMMTLLIIGFIFIGGILILLFLCSATLNVLLLLLGGNGNIYDVVKSILFSSGIFIAGAVNVALLILVKHKLISIDIWILFERIIYYIIAIFLMYLFTIIGENTHKLPRWRAVLAAAVPFAILVLINIVFSAKILPKLVGFFG